MTAEEPSEAELVANGLYDPAAPDAAVQLELIRYLVSVGATLDDLVEYRDELPALGTVVVARPGLPRYTADEVAAKTGLSYEVLTRLWRASGFPETPPGAVAFSDADLEMLQLIAGACILFGEEAVVQLARVIGSSLARIADAAVSSFLVNIEVPIVAQDPPALAIAKANFAAASLLPGLSRAMDVLLRHHILAARRSLLAWQETGIAGYEVQDLAVGFIDLVGSTDLAQRVSAGDLGRVLSEFEAAVADAVVARRGRVVKLIGDEVMLVAPDAAMACEVALEIASMFASHPRVPQVRAGVAAGEVLTRDGDYFGPVVNLAARVVKVAEPGMVSAPESLRAGLEAAGFRCEPFGTHPLKGIEPETSLMSVRDRVGVSSFSTAR
jgi:adenylate cyclase